MLDTVTSTFKDKYVKRGKSWTEKDVQCEIAPLP